MRGDVDTEKIRQFMVELGRRVTGPGRVFFTGGVTALWHGWRASTVDVDLVLSPEPAGGFEAIRAMKDDLDLNVELAGPPDFIPLLPGWEGRSEWIGRFGTVDFYHYDLFSQALSKIQRGLETDLRDVAAMLESERVAPEQLLRLFEQIRPDLKRYPRIDEDAFADAVRCAVERFLPGFQP